MNIKKGTAEKVTELIKNDLRNLNSQIEMNRRQINRLGEQNAMLKRARVPLVELLKEWAPKEQEES